MTAAGVKSNIAESFQQRWGADPDSQLQDSRAQVIEKEFWQGFGAYDLSIR